MSKKQYTSLLLLTILLITLPLFTQQKPLKQSKIIKAINCGLKQGTTKAQGDVKYQNDQALVTGSSVDVDYHSDSAASAADIKYTIEKQIYMYQRHTYSQMTYSLPIKAGKHTLIFKFAQMYFEKPGQRVFDIKIGDTIVIQNMDVIQKSGSKYAAHQQYLQFQVKDAAVYVGGVRIPNSVKAGNVQVTFVKGKADNPIIQAIIVYQGGVQQTTKQDYLLLKKNWGSHQQMLKAKKQNQKVKQLISMTKKKEKIIIRNDQLLLQQEQQQKGDQNIKRQKYGSIRSFLMSPIGILLWAAIFVYKLYFIYTKFFLLGRTVSQGVSKEE